MISCILTAFITVYIVIRCQSHHNMPGNYKNILGRRRIFKDKCLREYKITSLHTYTQRWQKCMNLEPRDINIFILKMKQIFNLVL